MSDKTYRQYVGHGIEVEYTPEEAAERRAFITVEVWGRVQRDGIVYYSELADELEYAGITRRETFDTIHWLERQGDLVRRKRKT